MGNNKSNRRKRVHTLRTDNAARRAWGSSKKRIRQVPETVETENHEALEEESQALRASQSATEGEAPPTAYAPVPVEPYCEAGTTSYSEPVEELNSEDNQTQ